MRLYDLGWSSGTLALSGNMWEAHGLGGALLATAHVHVGQGAGILVTVALGHPHGQRTMPAPFVGQSKATRRRAVAWAIQHAMKGA